MDALDLVSAPLRPFRVLCPIPEDPESVADRGAEVRPRDVGLTRAAVERIGDRVREVYRTGLYPAVQVALLRHGGLVLSRSYGHVRGGAPGDPPGAPKVPCRVDTPFNIFSASKAVTAMVIHLLEERGLFHLDDPVCEYIPEFGHHGKHRITIRHILAHRAGIPNLPPEALDLDLLSHPDEICRLLCELRLSSRPGRFLAYHAVTGGFVLGELVRRVTGRDIRDVLRKEIAEPLGLCTLGYGIAPERLEEVAENAFTGFPPVPPISLLLERALGADIHRVVELSNDPRFLLGVLPAANVCTPAEELARFYQCLLQEGELDGVRVFDRRTVRRATAEQSIWEIDFTLGVPLRYGLGFMLGGRWLSPYGPDTPEAFGHVGLSNIFSWADPERQIAVAILTSGKPLLTLDVARIFQLMLEIGRACPKVAHRRPRGGRAW